MSCVILSFVLSCDNLTHSCCSCRSQAPRKSSYNLENLQFVSRYFKQRFWFFFLICVFGQPLTQRVLLIWQESASVFREAPYKFGFLTGNKYFNCVGDAERSELYQQACSFADVTVCALGLLPAGREHTYLS